MSDLPTITTEPGAPEAAPAPPPNAPAPAPAPAGGGQPLNDPAFAALMAGGQPPPAAKPQSGKWNPAGQSFADKVNHWEGTGVAPGSGTHAAGLYQFEPGTLTRIARQYLGPQVQGLSDAQIIAKRSDPAFMRQAFDALTQDNAKQLRSAGIPATDAALYGAHWFGAGGFKKIFNADPDTPVDQIVGQQAAAENGLLKKDPKTGAVTKRTTVGQLNAMLAQRMGETYTPHHQTLQSTAEGAVQNFVPSAKRAVGEAVSGIEGAVKNPMGVVSGLGSLAEGAGSMVESWAGTNDRSPEERARVEAPLRQIGEDARNHYGSLQAIANTTANDPASVALNASMVTPLAEAGIGRVAGGVGKLGDLAGAGRVGDTLRAASGAIGTAGKAVGMLDPMKAVTAPLDALAPKSFNPSNPALDRAIRNATGDAMSAADVAALPPEARSRFMATVRQKGVSAPAVNEALMRAMNQDVAASFVTGEAPSELARSRVENMRTGNVSGLADEARVRAGATGPSETGLAGKFAEAQAADMNSIKDAYDALARQPGSFGPAVPRRPLFNDMASEVATSAQRPVANGAALARYVSRGDTPESLKALQRINDVMTNGQYAFRGPAQGLNAPELMQLRRDLTDHLYRAKGEDAAIMKGIVNGWQNHIENLSGRGLFRGPGGQPAQEFMSGLKAANARYAQHMGTFNEGVFRKATDAVGNTADANGRLTPTVDAATLQAAQPLLTANLFDPAKGAAHYNRLAAIFDRAGVPGGKQALDDFIRHSVYETKGGQLNPARGVEAALYSPTSAVAASMSPAEVAYAKAMHQTHRLNVRPYKRGSQRRATAHGVMSTALRYGAKGAAGYIGDKLGGLPGFMIAQGLEHGAEKTIDAMKLSHELKGAHPHRGPVAKAAQTARLAANPYLIQAARASDQRAGHAGGGKVESADERLERLVGRLMTQAKAAKKQSNAATEPLLNAPDEAIVKALAVAQRAI